MNTSRKKVRSMNSQIWRMVIGILFLFLISLTIINSVILKELKEKFIFDQLKEAAQTKKNVMENDTEKKLINRFIITKSEKGYSILVHPKALDHYKNNDRESHMLQAIINKVLEDINKESYTLGKISLEGDIHYYYAEWEGNSENIIVWMTSAPIEPLIPLSFIIAFIITLIISFLVTKMISNKIVKPIYDLESFAEDIALHKWDLIQPTSDIAEIQQLSNSLNHMKEVLKAREDRERDFLQSTSHSLKTPIMVIEGYAQAMIDGLLVNSNESPAQIIRREAENLKRRVSQLLKFNTYGYMLEAEQKKEHIGIDRLINSLIRKFKIIRSDLHWDVYMDSIEILGNSEALLTAFENLLENQIRYAKSVIRVILKNNTTSVNPSIVIKFTNDGPHFNQEDPMCLFERYKKDKSGQWGLGLAIVKQIVEAHEGSITAQNIDEGVEFIVILPI